MSGQVWPGRGWRVSWGLGARLTLACQCRGPGGGKGPQEGDVKDTWGQGGWRREARPPEGGGRHTALRDVVEEESGVRAGFG